MASSYPDLPTTAHFRAEDPLDSDATVIGAAGVLTAAHYPSSISSVELVEALKGQLLNNYLLQEFIGGGGMGVVFKALDITLDRAVAVKVVSAQRSDDEEMQRRFLVEAQSTARLDHPNIARVHYVGRDRGLPYIVFEYIDGENLRDMTAKYGPLPIGDALSYAYQIAHALDHASNRGIVHRDIKPSNILIDRQGQAKLVDMGLARLRQVDSREEDLTATGMTLGTFDYISPEQARDPREADCRSDIYSLGCTLFSMLTGQAPFAEGNAVQKLLHHQEDAPPDVKSLRPETPHSLAQLIERMLAKAPGLRPQTPAELSHELAIILRELHLPLPHPLSPLAAFPRRRKSAWPRRHLPWLAPTSILLATGVWLGGGDDAIDPATAFAPLRVLPRADAAPAEESTPTPPDVRGASAPQGASPNAASPSGMETPPSRPAQAAESQREFPNLDLGKTLSDLLSKWPPGSLGGDDRQLFGEVQPDSPPPRSRDDAAVSAQPRRRSGPPSPKPR